MYSPTVISHWVWTFLEKLFPWVRQLAVLEQTGVRVKGDLLTAFPVLGAACASLKGNLRKTLNIIKFFFNK